MRRVVLTMLATASCVACATPTDNGSADERTAAAVRAAEINRLRALVNADIGAANLLHAEDFQVVNPRGLTASRDQFLQYVANGTVDYLEWTPEAIDVRRRGRMAAIRYRSRVLMVARGQRLAPMLSWNTGVYELRDGRWQIVWFQVTEIAGAGG